MQKKILGLDLGVSSIGWAMIEENNNRPARILGLGTRVIPLSTEDKEEFSTGNTISKNRQRTQKRTQRKGYDRYQLRRKYLVEVLQAHHMMPDEKLMQIDARGLYGLRAKATTEEVTLQELGRILYHLNQKRGYKSSRTDEATGDKKDTEYVAQVKERHRLLHEKGITIGQYFFQHLQNDKFYRVKDQVFPREAFMEEFDAIMRCQRQFHPVLSDALIKKIRNEIIYYQRPLKSQKGLVSICEFEGVERKNGAGKAILTGPKVAPRSSPLFQLCRIWETVNNINLKIKNSEGAKYKWANFTPTLAQKQQLATHLFTHKTLTANELLKILQLNKNEVYLNKQLAKGIKGNNTYAQLNEWVENKDLLRFEVEMLTTGSTTCIADKKTGEVIAEEAQLFIHPNYQQQPLYQLWHTVYAIKDLDECKQALIKKFGFEEATAAKIAAIDFTKEGYGEKSIKAIRKILPYLMKGYNYADACTLAGYNHSNSLTKEEKSQQTYANYLELLPKNSLRQPVIEKILNQMIHLVNAITEKYGKPDAIRVEMARELKQSREERNEAFKENSLNEKLHQKIEERLKELGLRSTRNMILKYKLIFPAKDKKWDEAAAVNQCIYCGESFNLTEALQGENFDVDHIIPQSLLFDDSQNNKVLVHRKCNKDKTNNTAYDYMAQKGEKALTEYIQRVDDWYNRGLITYGKMQRLKTSYLEYLERKKYKRETEADRKLWENFISRQMRETAYIARKATQLLHKICPEVTTTTGTITAELRRLWGWEDALRQLQLPRYRALNLTVMHEPVSEDGSNGGAKETILGWSKRDDHRHHALDALTIACTRQGYIQRFNTLNASEVRNAMLKEIEEAGTTYEKKYGLLENYIISQPHFSTEEVKQALAKVLISYKPGKKAATTGKRKVVINGRKQVVQDGIIVPRGALCEESVYGIIRTLEPGKPLKYLFENPDLIFKNYIRQKVEERLAQYNNDAKVAYASLKKDPIYLDAEKQIKLEYATCYRQETVMKYPLASLKAKDIPYIVDKKIRSLVQARLEQYHNNEKEAFKDLENNPLWFDAAQQIPIRTVRMFTKLNAVEPVKKNTDGQPIGYAKPGNNHHIAIYRDADGEYQEHLCSLWHAVDRKRYQLPIIIQNPSAVWSKILQQSDQYPAAFLEKLPSDGWEFFMSFQQNEMFVLGLDPETLHRAIASKNYDIISPHLYRVQKLSSSNGNLDIWFRHHLETEVKDTPEAKKSRRYIRITSIKALINENTFKIYVNKLGDIVV